MVVKGTRCKKGSSCFHSEAQIRQDKTQLRLLGFFSRFTRTRIGSNINTGDLIQLKLGREGLDRYREFQHVQLIDSEAK